MHWAHDCSELLRSGFNTNLLDNITTMDTNITMRYRCMH